DELVAVLGLGLMTVAVDDEPDIGRWAAYGRDVFLEDAAETYGIRLRALHPRRAAVGLGGSPEFAAHFRESYAPLIHRALAHDQPVLAWRGWAGDDFGHWGVITHLVDERFFGFAGGQYGIPTPLSDAAHQAYVVEAVEPTFPKVRAAKKLFVDVRARVRELWEGCDSCGPTLQTGKAAYEVWLERLRGLRIGSDEAEAFVRRQSDCLRVMSSARRSFGRWLATVADQLSNRAGNDPGLCVKVIEQGYSLVDGLADLDPAGTTSNRGMLDVKLVSSIDEAIVEALSEYS
ncbi:MAG: hypothetical protein IID33_11375, partial [Planctomycetes bacterium]|nr:hypothetical protein [Planctomycetota bacterium]